MSGITAAETKSSGSDQKETKTGVQCDGSKPIGSGFNGVVYRPPPPANQPDLDRFCHPKYVLKVTSRECAMYAVRVAQVIRSGWHTVASKKAPSCSPDDYFLLPFDLVRDMSRYPAEQIDTAAHTSDSLRRWMNRLGGSSKPDELVGIYMLDGGVSWASWFHDGAKKGRHGEAASRHLIEGVLALHSVGICHLDIHGRNVLIDVNGIPRLIDFESATIDRPGEPAASIRDQASSTTAWWAAVAGGRGNFGPKEQKAKDWIDVASLITKTAATLLQGEKECKGMAAALAADPNDETAALVLCGK
jgi:serine/threonine protein kinase